MRTRAFLYLGMALGILAYLTCGCATASRQDWTKDAATAEDLARDRYACIQASGNPYDTSYGALVGGGSGSPPGGGWGSRASVVRGGTDGGFIFFGATRAAQSEANRLYDACMESRGWRSR